ncbi:helix-turn-helix domain-containing protein [Oceanospirillum sediminis]|uniref:Helix-turn-helix domain-containing protein n=1 Tax=Oceanospirillum sediminis TaxID=2760088 RepID=A0A839IRA7_9GAMM|nr:helix-turn-helix domain-containing protein [Oceanospirillum sediminis]MBB1487230.1 helix-turn-helix domain-containing protein [Oceanospirillum sediminis]
MRYAILKQKAVDFFAEASFVGRIHNEAEYEQALELMDELIEDYDKYLPLIEVLSVSIEKWEEESEYFSDFNKRIAALDDGAAILRTIMDQYHLKADDLKDELGSKSLVSMILNGSRSLTRDHIQALSQRFKISPSVFFNGA